MKEGTDPQSRLAPSLVTARSLVIVGLPASGKTSYARTLLAGRSHYEDIHHWLYYRAQHIRDGDDRFGRFLDDLALGRPWVIDSVEMCDQVVRERFISDYLADASAVDWIFFENNPERCKQNAQVLEHRGEGHREHRLREIDRVRQIYTIPAGAATRKVYRPVGRLHSLTQGDQAVETAFGRAP